MKKLFNIFLGCASLLMVAYSCEAEQPTYEGDSYVHFQVDSQEMLATAGTPYAEAKIDYGTTHAVNGDHQVKLVLDKANSTAVEGVDFEILNNDTSLLASGASNGQFTIRALTPQMTQSPKVAIFTIASSTLPTAVFNNKLIVKMSLTCPISAFVGTFQLTESFFWDAGEQFDIEPVPGATNKLKIIGFMDGNADFIVDYNPDTYVVTFATQGTTYVHPTYGKEILIRPASNTALVSSFNPCTRKLTIYMDYWMDGVGGWTNQKEAFSGL